MPDDTASSPGNQPETRPPGNVPTTGAPPPVPAPAPSHQLTTFPVIAVILLHYCTCGIFSLVWLNLMHGKLSRIRSDDPSAGRAVGFCFIPFFNLYWIFFTLRRLSLRVDEQRELYGLPPSNLRGLATTACIFQVIPYINFLLGYTIITPIYLGLMQSSVNQLARTSATTAPRRTLTVQPAQAEMSVGTIVLICLCPILFIFLTAILAAMLLPALAAAQRKAQVINSENNMKTIGVAFRIWEGEHNGQFPFNVSQAQGGTMELCSPGSDGFEQNPAVVFMVMSNELASPKILVCPNDPGKRVAPNFASLTADNISYELRTGPNITDKNPEEVLAVDPINGIVLHCDGSVLRDIRYKKPAGR